MGIAPYVPKKVVVLLCNLKKYEKDGAIKPKSQRDKAHNGYGSNNHNLGLIDEVTREKIHGQYAFDWVKIGRPNMAQN